MISRRELLSAGMAGGFASSADTTPATSAVNSQDNSDELRRISNDIRGLDSSISRAWLSSTPEIPAGGGGPEGWRTRRRCYRSF